MKNILFITSTNLSSNPRCLKEITAVAGKGYGITVLKFDFNNWTSATEGKLEEQFPAVRWLKVSASRTPLFKWLSATIKSRIAVSLSKLLKANSKWLAFSMDKRSILIHQELKSLVPDFSLLIAHNPGAFWPASNYAKRNNIPLGVDIEDYHPGETNNDEDSTRMLRLMNATLPTAAYITAASPLILEYTLDNINISGSAEVINNVFSLKDQPLFQELPVQKGEPLCLFWFSQHVGLDRGLQEVINAINTINNFPVVLTLLGNCSAEVKTTLEDLFINTSHSLVFKPACTQQQLMAEAAANHIGLALETAFSLNRNIALTNKIFTYFLAGNAVIASDTSAQKLFMEQYSEGGIVYPIGDSTKLAGAIVALHSDQKRLSEMRQYNYRLAQEQLNWEAAQEQFLTLVTNTIA